MKVTHPVALTGALVAGVLAAGAAAAEHALFVKVEDLTPSGDGAYSGADIDAIELASPNRHAAFYAAAVIDSEKPPNAGNAGVLPEHALGQPVLLDADAPYVFAPNGGWLIARIDVRGEAYTDEWRLTVYEVDGFTYPLSGAPEPYRVSVALAEDGPWQELGIGSGTSRWTLDGTAGMRFDDARVERIEAALARELDIEPITEAQYGMVAGTIARISALDDIAQLQAELVGLHTYFEYIEHVVNDHGEKDGGRVYLARLVLRTAWDRYRSITGS
jgi:hypothetical protein